MIKIGIDDSTKEFETADAVKPQWIREQIQNRPKDNSDICMRVVIDENGKSVRLQTSACGNGSGGGRSPRPEEKEIFELWNRKNLNEDNYNLGNLISFFKNLKHVC